MADEYRQTPTDAGVASPDAASEAILREVEAQEVLPSQVNAADATAAVMCVLSHRLTGGEARDLVDHLPPPLRSILFSCAAHPEQPEVFDRDVFIRRVSEHLNVDPDQAERITVGVFVAVRKHLSAKEIHDVFGQLPRDLQALWGPP